MAVPSSPFSVSTKAACRRYIHCFRDLSGFKRNVDPELPCDIEFDTVTQELAEPGYFRLNFVSAGREELE